MSVKQRVEILCAVFFRCSFLFILLTTCCISVAKSQISTPEEARRSMVHLLADDSNCNGVLLNNTQSDGKVYVLTAGHCITEDNRFLSATFGRDFLLDQSTIRTAEWSTEDITILRLSRDLDYMLLEINEEVPEHILAYYAGWNIAPTIPLSTYSIHSPDIAKRVNEDFDQPEFATFDVITTFGGTPVDNATFNIGDWESGFTEAGSSGAPLFNQWSQMIGVLSGGSSTADNPVNDFYSRMDLIYNDGVSDWINPDGRSLTALRGLDFQRERVSLFKQTNFSRTSAVEESVDATVFSESFESSGFRVLVGMFLTTMDVVPTDLLDIRIIASDEIVFEQQVFTGSLTESYENYIPFASPINLNGDFVIEVSHNNSLTVPLLQSEGGSVNIGGDNQTGRSLGISALLRGVPEPTENTGETSTPYPIPTNGNLFVNRGDLVDINSIEMVDASGFKLRPRVTIDYNNRLIIDLNAFPKGVYVISFQLMGEMQRSRIILD